MLLSGSALMVRRVVVQFKGPHVLADRFSYKLGAGAITEAKLFHKLIRCCHEIRGELDRNVVLRHRLLIRGASV